MTLWITANGFFVLFLVVALDNGPSSFSWTLVLANSKGYVTAHSIPPAVPPAIRETNGDFEDELETIFMRLSSRSWVDVDWTEVN
jgi:hypothetical protein